LKVDELDEVTIHLLRNLKKSGVFSPKDALTVSEIVKEITGLNNRRSPILYGLEYNKISNEIRLMHKHDLINCIEKKNKESYYLTKNGKNYI
jgi:predicted transcriptional regulator